jgi:N utilization substance protein B
MDVIIMQTALAEILSFPNIPISVSLNEYLEIAKLYSTRKSAGFINGTLDGIINNLKKDGKLNKQ